MNDCSRSARVRLSFSAGNGSLYDFSTAFHYIIECWPMPNNLFEWNAEGLQVGLFGSMQKSANEYSSVKSASAQLYSIAGRWMQQRNWQDCILLNQYGNVCETSIANIFWIKDKNIHTPSLKQGCVAGVMRAWLMEQEEVIETDCQPDRLMEADEVFITNAIKGIQWVKTIGEINFNSLFTRMLYDKHIVPLRERQQLL